jgi:hypothetical protein
MTGALSFFADCNASASFVQEMTFRRIIDDVRRAHRHTLRMGILVSHGTCTRNKQKT